MISYYKDKKSYDTFPCRKNYNLITNNYTKFIINKEISLLFNQTKSNCSIKLTINVNENIDHSLKILKSLLKDYSQYL